MSCFSSEDIKSWLLDFAGNVANDRRDIPKIIIDLCYACCAFVVRRRIHQIFRIRTVGRRVASPIVMMKVDRSWVEVDRR